MNQAVELEAEKCPRAVHLMKQTGVGPVTALAFVLTLRPVERFHKSKQVVSYLGHTIPQLLESTFAYLSASIALPEALDTDV